MPENISKVTCIYTYLIFYLQGTLIWVEPIPTLWGVHSLWSTQNSRLFNTFQGQNVIKFKTIFRSISSCRHSKGGKWCETSFIVMLGHATWTSWIRFFFLTLEVGGLGRIENSRQEYVDSIIYFQGLEVRHVKLQIIQGFPNCVIVNA
jgi:hypothetical protein